MGATNLPNSRINPQDRLVSLYAISGAQLSSISEFLWSATFYTDPQLMLFGNPSEAVISVRAYPFPIFEQSGNDHIFFGNKDSGVGSVLMLSAVDKLVIFDGSYIPFPSNVGDYTDYSPFAAYDVFLPYIGFVTFPAEMLLDKYLKLEYYVDYITGGCTAFLSMRVIEAGQTEWHVIWSQSGQIGIDIPVSSTNENQRQKQILASLVSMTGQIAAGGAAGGTVGAVAGVVSGLGGVINAAQEHVYKGGVTDSMLSLCAPQKVYAVITRARQLGTGTGYAGLRGLPMYSCTELSTLRGSGYARISDVHVAIPGATQSEMEEIESLLKGGVIL